MEPNPQAVARLRKEKVGLKSYKITIMGGEGVPEHLKGKVYYSKDKRGLHSTYSRWYNDLYLFGGFDGSVKIEDLCPKANASYTPAKKSPTKRRNDVRSILNPRGE